MKCESITTPEFDKLLKKTDPQVAKLINNKIKELINDENNPQNVADGIKAPHLKYGKFLTQIGLRDSFALEVTHKIRAIATVFEENGTKVYVWTFGGSHEAYNNIYKNQKSISEPILQKVKEKFTEMSKSSVEDRIKNIKSQFAKPHKPSEDKKYEC